MEKIPSAEEFLLHDYDASSRQENGSVFTKDAIEKMIEFAKYHCTQALRQASENAKIINHKPTVYDDRVYKKVCENSILNAYDLTLIK